MAFKLLYLGFILTVLAGGGVICALHGGYLSDPVWVSGNVATGVGAAAAALLIGSFGRRYVQNRLMGHILGTLIVASLGLYGQYYSNNLLAAENTPDQAVRIAPQSAPPAAHPGGATCIPPKAGAGAVMSAAAQDLMAGLQQQLDADYAKTAELQQTSAEEAGRTRLAAQSGDAAAEYHLGELYSVGGGVLKDLAEAEHWFTQAARHGDPIYQYRLATIYDFGGYIPADASQAEHWYRLAAQQGYAEAQAGLGGYYRAGKGGASDPVLAHMWYNIADLCGYASAGSSRDDLERQMTGDQIAQATARARQCVDTGFAECD